MTDKQHAKNFLKSCNDQFDIHFDKIQDKDELEDSKTCQTDDSHNLVELIYVSKISWLGRLNPSTLRAIEKVASYYNELHGLTGILCYANGYFYQCVEGNYHAVMALKNNLCADKRHHSVQIYSLEAIEQRRYQDWKMSPLILESWQLTKQQRKRLVPLKNYLPFAPTHWTKEDWQGFNHHIQQFDALASDLPLPNLSQYTLSHRIKRFLSPHQAFLAVQTALLLLLVVSFSTLS